MVEGLRDGGRALGFRSPLRSSLLAGQVALCVVLLIGASLSARSLANAHAVYLGFTPEGVAMASLDLELSGYDRNGRSSSGVSCGRGSPSRPASSPWASPIECRSS